MRIAFDVLPITGYKLTGISYNELYTILEIQKKYINNDYIYNFSCLNNKMQRLNRVTTFIKYNNVIIQVCYGLKAFFYSITKNIFPIPYTFFFKESAQITHFFNFLIPRGIKGKKVLTVHDMTYYTYPDTMRFFTKLAFALNLKLSCKRADKIIAVSEFTKKEIIRFLHINHEKIIVIPNAVDTTIFHPMTDLKSIENIKKKYNIATDYFIYIGTLEPRKNLIRLIKAYKLLKEKHLNVPKLLIGGKQGWFYESIFDTVQSLQLEKDIIFLDYVPEEDKVPLLCGSLAFLFLSLYEGFGIPPLEAMACGIPVLISNTASLPEVVGDAALLVNPFDIEDISRGMEGLLYDDNLRKDLSKRGLERAKIFSWERVAAMTMDVYNSLI
jgi:glycosyltransferase involved in cell wall biosynthesis